MNRLFELWKWKLIITIICVIYFTLPVIVNWDRVDFASLLLIYTCMPILIWLSVTYGLYEYGKELKKELKNKDSK